MSTGISKCMLVWASLVYAGLPSCSRGLPDINPGSLSGQVLAGAPVADARVEIWQLDPAGARVELLYETCTDAAGMWSVDIGLIIGPIEIDAIGGTTTEPWEPGRMIPVERSGDAEARPLRAVLIDYVSGYPARVTITPYTTLAATLGEAWQGPEQSYSDAIRDAYQRLGQHLGDISLFDNGPLDRADPTRELDRGMRHALMIETLSSLAERMAGAAGTTARGINTVTVTDALDQDAQDGVFDGLGPAGTVRVCAQPPTCAADPAACLPLCDLDANTLRAELATALAFWFLPGARNWTGYAFADVQPIIEALRTSDDVKLFGQAGIAPLGGEPPVIEVQSTLIYDEIRDTITFTAAAEPVHTAQGPLLALGDSEVCPTVHKYVTHMDDPHSNALRWAFQVIDRRGVGIVPTGGAYRVRGANDVAWLTDWRAAVLVPESVENGYSYEVVLTRPALPALGTTRAIFEIEFRGMDTLGQLTPVARACWEHVPLAAPLYVSDAREVPASDPLSLHAAGLGAGLAALLNSAPLSEGRALLEFDIKNGTDEPVYITLDIDQAAATFAKSWQKTNAYLFENPTPSYCLRDGLCTQQFPPDAGTTVVEDMPGTVAQLVGGLWVVDTATGMRLAPCIACNANEYRIEPRYQGGAPRIYRVLLITSDLSALAPRPVDVDYGPYGDVSLDPDVLPFPISGRRLGRLAICRDPDPEDPGICRRQEFEYVHYLALSEARIDLEWLRVQGRTRAALSLDVDVPTPQLNTFGLPVQMGPYSWSVQQSPSLPTPTP